MVRDGERRKKRREGRDAREAFYHTVNNTKMIGTVMAVSRLEAQQHNTKTTQST